MGSLGLVVLAIALGGVLPDRAVAAREQEGAAVIAAAVSDLLRQLRINDGVPDGTVMYDPRLLEPRERHRPDRAAPLTYYALGEQINEAANAAFAAEGAQRGDMESVLRCPTESPRSCTLCDGAAAIFATSAPTFEGDTARVVVKALWMSDLAKQPVQEGVFRLTLSRQPGGWRVVRTETLFIS